MENWEEKFDEIYNPIYLEAEASIAEDVDVKLKDLIRALLEPKKPDKRNPEIQALWEYGLELGFTETKQHLQRFALKRLLAKHEPEKLRVAAKYTTTIKSDRYAPQVNNWLDLEDKFQKLRDYVARQQQKPKTINLDVL